MTPDQSNMCLMVWQPGTDYTKLYKNFKDQLTLSVTFMDRFVVLVKWKDDN